MKRFSFLVFFLIFGFCLFAQEIILDVPEYPPFTFKENDKLQGIGIDVVTAVLKKAGIQYKLNYVANYTVALRNVQNGTSDGFFLATKNTEREEVAVLSDSVMFNNWIWVLLSTSNLDPKSKNFKEFVKIGSISNSNTSKWLKDNKFIVSVEPSDSESLVRAFNAGRCESLFVSELVFDDALKALGEDSKKYKKYLEDAKPFGVYFSKKTLSREPTLLTKFNAAIKMK